MSVASSLNSAISFGNLTLTNAQDAGASGYIPTVAQLKPTVDASGNSYLDISVAGGGTPYVLNSTPSTLGGLTISNASMKGEPGYVSSVSTFTPSYDVNGNAFLQIDVSGGGTPYLKLPNPLQFFGSQAGSDQLPDDTYVSAINTTITTSGVYILTGFVNIVNPCAVDVPVDVNFYVNDDPAQTISFPEVADVVPAGSSKSYTLFPFVMNTVELGLTLPAVIGVSAYANYTDPALPAVNAGQMYVSQIQ